MGESYLQRKLFNRLKKTPQQTTSLHHRLQIRSATSTSICSLQTSNKLIQQTGIRDRIDNKTIPDSLDSSTAEQQQQRQQVLQNISIPSPVPSSSSAPLPLNVMIRQHSEAISSPFSSNNNLNDEPPIEVCDQNLSYAGDDDDDDGEDDDHNRQGKSSRRTKALQTPTSTPNPAKRSKLKSVTKAILFFRKQKISFGGSTRSSSTSNQSSSNQLNRQSTNDSSWSQNMSSPSPNNQQLKQHTTSSSGLDLPQFIVPKMNALRLPLVCLIKSLNGELMREVFVHRYELGEYLMENLKVSFELNDCKYFGLKFAKTFDDQEDLRNNWLDLNESVCKQIKTNKLNVIQVNNNGTRSIEFYLRIKFYPPNLTRVQDSFLRNYLWLQLRRDLRLGKLTSSMSNLTLLMACVLQYELGDYYVQKQLQEPISERPPSLRLSSETNQQSLDETNQANSRRNYSLEQQIADLNILPNQDLIEEQAIEMWRSRLVGMRQYQAQMQFLRAAVILETYGFDYYPVRDHQRQRAYLLGFNYAGIKTIRNGRIAHHFRWHNISKISYERRMIIFHIYPNENSKRKQILGFKCLSNEDCQNLYMRLLEQKYFFTVDLAYFDKSVRRPSYLFESRSDSLLDWSSLAVPSTRSNNNNTNSNNALTAAISSSKIAAQLYHTNGHNNVAAEHSNGTSFESLNVEQQDLELGEQADLELTQQNGPIGHQTAGKILASKQAQGQTSPMETNKQSSALETPYSSNIFPHNSQVTEILEAKQTPSPSGRRSLGGKRESSETSLSHHIDSVCTQCCPTTSSRPVNLNASSSGGGLVQSSSGDSGHKCKLEEGLNSLGTRINVEREQERCVTGSSFSSPFNRKVEQASSTATRNILQRQQSTMQYESSMSSFPSRSQGNSSRPTRASNSSLNKRDRLSSNKGGWKWSGIWSKVPFSLRQAASSGDREQQEGHMAQHSNSYQFFHRLIEFAESILIEPVASIQQHSQQDSSRRGFRGNEDGAGNEISSGEHSRFLLPAIRLCLLILLINVMLRVSENLSNILIDSFTFGAHPNNIPSAIATTTTTAAATSHAISDY